MAAIATEAGVALKTVYLAFETKSGVLRALWNVTLRGDDGDVPVAEQAWYRETLDEPDPERQLRLNARNSRRGKERVAGVGEVIRSGARRPIPRSPALGPHPGAVPREPAHDRREPRREEGAGRSTSIAPPTSSGRSTTPNTWQLLVGERGWTADEYEAVGRRHARAASCSAAARSVGRGAVPSLDSARWTWSASSRLSAWKRS